MIKKISIAKAIFGIAVTIMFSCEKNVSDDKILNKGPYQNGVFITNEGSYGNSNGSISFYSYNENQMLGIKADTVYNSIFSEVNQRDLGDVVQSITIYDSLAFIVVNNSNKVEVVTFADFKEKAVITGISQPRYFIANGTTGYLSAWGDGGVVYVIDLTSFKVSSYIKVGNGPEKMLIDGNKLYVANSGGLLSDSTINIIDIVSNQIIDTILVGGNPRAIEKDKDGNKWILCYGIIEYNPVDYSISRETPSLLVKLNKDDERVLSITLSGKEHPSTMALNPDHDRVYFGGGYSYKGIWGISINSTNNNSVEIVSDLTYSFMISQKTGELFAFLAPSFTENGLLKRYTPEGVFIKSYSLGIGPNGGASTENAYRK
jgi:YVTN family beta-propeller protein